ncbi:MAG TPA: carboxymuconolactone decarboxylase family protein [Burkholderiales bacterium]|jgi:4-carboxymuconolactone decarboxylase
MPAKSKDPLFEKGLRIRAEVLGAEHVARRTQAPNQYARPFEEFTTKAAWGLIWSRPGLSRKSRSLLNLGMLTALGQPQELRLHIRAALRNGLTRTEIVEALLHTAVYCGIPKCSEARRAMLEVFDQLDAEQSAPKKRRRSSSR